MKKDSHISEEKRRDGRSVARENETRVLRALHRFGWLRTRDIAALVFGDWSNKPESTHSLAPVMPSASAIRMAQRTLRRMKEAKLLLAALGPDGSTVYALAEAGTRKLQAIGIAAVSGKDAVRGISSSYFRHRCIANELAIAGIVQGYRVSTEREIARGLWVGGEAGVAGKKPDVLWRNQGSCVWIEVQRSRHNAKDYAHLIAWLEYILALAAHQGGHPEEQKLKFEKIIFVCTPALAGKLTRDLQAKKVSEIALNSLIYFEKLLYKFEDIRFR